MNTSYSYGLIFWMDRDLPVASWLSFSIYSYTIHPHPT